MDERYERDRERERERERKNEKERKWVRAREDERERREEEEREKQEKGFCLSFLVMIVVCFFILGVGKFKRECAKNILSSAY